MSVQSQGQHRADLLLNRPTGRQRISVLRAQEAHTPQAPRTRTPRASAASPVPEKSTLHGDPGVHLDARIMLGIATLPHGAKVEELYRSLHTTLRVLNGRATPVTPRQNSPESPPQVCKYVEGDGAEVMHVPSHSVPDDIHSLMATF